MGGREEEGRAEVREEGRGVGGEKGGGWGEGPEGREDVSSLASLLMTILNFFLASMPF